MSRRLHEFAEAAGRVAVAFQAAPPGVPSRVWAQLSPWVQRLMLSATSKWLPRVTAEFPCQVPVYRKRQPIGPCTKHAVAVCDVCGRATCLDHCRVDQFGDAICYLCVMEAQQRRSEAGPRPESTWESQEPPPHTAQHAVPDEAAVRAAYNLLGVSSDVSDEELKSVYRRALARSHPDRYRTKPKKEAAERRFKEIQAAYKIIERSRQEAA